MAKRKNHFVIISTCVAMAIVVLASQLSFSLKTGFITPGAQHLTGRTQLLTILISDYLFQQCLLAHYHCTPSVYIVTLLLTYYYS